MENKVMSARDIRKELAAGGFMTMREVEEFTGLKKSKIYNLMADGSLPYAKIGSARRIPRAALIEFLGQSIVMRGEN